MIKTQVFHRRIEKMNFYNEDPELLNKQENRISQLLSILKKLSQSALPLEEKMFWMNAYKAILDVSKKYPKKFKK